MAKKRVSTASKKRKPGTKAERSAKTKDNSDSRKGPRNRVQRKRDRRK